MEMPIYVQFLRCIELASEWWLLSSALIWCSLLMCWCVCMKIGMAFHLPANSKQLSDRAEESNRLFTLRATPAERPTHGFGSASFTCATKRAKFHGLRTFKTAGCQDSRKGRGKEVNASKAHVKARTMHIAAYTM